MAGGGGRVCSAAKREHENKNNRRMSCTGTRICIPRVLRCTRRGSTQGKGLQIHIIIKFQLAATQSANFQPACSSQPMDHVIRPVMGGLSSFSIATTLHGAMYPLPAPLGDAGYPRTNFEAGMGGTVKPETL
eukprot:Rhum_TRINITY_DN15518_c0_g1::Rhum_TRINITY_DN15518_c0_g1_i1::g.161091::m.161091